MRSGSGLDPVSFSIPNAGRCWPCREAWSRRSAEPVRKREPVRKGAHHELWEHAATESR
jgi:hypothetical protein